MMMILIAMTRSPFDELPMLTAEDFRNALRERFLAAIARGASSLVIRAGDLHREVGSYPGHDHQMPNCCSVMRQEMRSDDSIVSSPPSGKGASLEIRYKLPR